MNFPQNRQTWLLFFSLLVLLNCAKSEESASSPEQAQAAANTAATPTFSPTAGAFTTAQSVAISTSTSGAVICYTTNGAAPECNTAKTGCATGTLFAANVSVATTQTLRAIACKSAFTDSSVATAAYVIDGVAPSAPASPGATAASVSQINLSWTASTDNVTPQGSLVYEICQSTTGGGCDTFSVIFTTAAAATTYNATGLGSATTYYFRVRAKDLVNNTSASTAEFSATTQSCGGCVTTLAGSGSNGSVNATGTLASFNAPQGVAVDASGNVYVADYANSKIRKITSSGVVTTLAGSGSTGSVDATGSAASFNFPKGVAVDSSGNVFVADTTNHKIRKITAAGVVTTMAGSGTLGSTDATGIAASFNYPADVAVDTAGNVYVADTENHRIRKITSAGVVTTFVGSGSQGSADATGTAATFSYPSGVAVDSAGNVYVSDTANHKIRKITPGAVVTTLAGSGLQGSADGPGATATISSPMNLSVDSSGNIYVSSMTVHKIRKITSTGNVSTLAGSGAVGSIDATGTSATFYNPIGCAVGTTGIVYIGDNSTNKIRKILP